MSDDDRALGEEPTEVSTVDVSPATEPEDFDFDEFLAGARPTRRAVQVFAKAHLVAEMEEMASEYDRADSDGATRATLKGIEDRFTAARAEFYGSGRWFVCEARSSERIDHVRKDAARRHGITLPPDDATGDDAMIPRADYDTIQRAILADSIVSPSVTEDALARMASHLPTEYPKLVVAMQQANSRLAEGAQVLTRDFSRGRSSKTGTGGSARR